MVFKHKELQQDSNLTMESVLRLCIFQKDVKHTEKVKKIITEQLEK
jgi:hypothetical protein